MNAYELTSPEGKLVMWYKTNGASSIAGPIHVPPFFSVANSSFLFRFADYTNWVRSVGVGAFRSRFAVQDNLYYQRSH